MEGTPIGPPRGTLGRPRRRPWLPVLMLAGSAAAVAAIPWARGADLIPVLAVLAAFLALASTAALLSRSPRGPAAAAARICDSACAAADRALGGRRPGVLLGVMMVLYALVWSALSILRHDALNSTGFDLAIQHQVIWNLAHGRGFASSVEVTNYLGDHVCLTMPLFAPFLWVKDDVRMLLIAQSIVLSLGAWPLYRLARRRCGSALDGLFWAGLYLLTPAIGFMNRYDFHEVVLALPFLLAAIDALDEGRLARATVWLTLAAATREEVGIAVAAIGVWAFLARRPRGWGAAVTLGAFAWSVVALYVVLPHFRLGASSDTLARYAWLGGTPGVILRTLVIEPWRLFATHYHRVRRMLYPVQLLWPMGGLPLLAPGPALLAIPNLALSLTSSNVSQNSIYFQYNAPILPALFWAAVEGHRRLLRSGRSRGLVLASLLACLAAANVADPAAVKDVRKPYAVVDGIRPRPNVAAFREAEVRIPPDADLVASNDLAPHFSARAHIYVMNPRFPMPDTPWVILDLTDTRHIDSRTELARAAADWVEAKGYRVSFCRDGIVVLRHEGEEDAAARAELRVEVGRQGVPLP